MSLDDICLYDRGAGTENYERIGCKGYNKECPTEMVIKYGN